MFFGRKKNSKGKERTHPRSERNNLNEFGLPMGPSNDDDDELEAELFKLTGQKSSQVDELLLTGDEDADIEQELALILGNAGRGTKSIAAGSSRPRLLDATVAASGSIDLEEGGDEEDIDENDPDLLNELAMITQEDDVENDVEIPPEVEETPKEINQLELIRARLGAYKLAEASAKKSNEASRARRFNRGVKTLEKLIKKASSGEFVPFDEIPPEIATNLKPPSASLPDAKTGGETSAAAAEPSPDLPYAPQVIPGSTVSGNTEENVERTKELNQHDLIKSRLEAYRSAEAIAKNNNDSSRARRFNRGVKMLEKLLVKVTNGEFVPFDEIPPEITTNLKPASAYLEVKAEDDESAAEKSAAAIEPSPSMPHEEPSASLQPVGRNEEEAEETKPTPLPANQEAGKVSDNVDSSMLSMIEIRREEFKAAALNSKKRGDLSSALTYVKSIKTCDRLISELKAGKSINVSEIPQPIGVLKPAKERLVQGSSYPKGYNLYGEVFEIPATVKEALEQRLAYYEKAFRKAEASNNRIEARRNGDVVRIYQNAIRLYQKGSRVPFEKLPSPPGCPPIPLSF